ncbi:MAG: DUF2958 domain-containing protein [Propionibacteriales bacterium]|nr:DUF2958 domain-containing protein [Propionibacteriales bacterium]
MTPDELRGHDWFPAQDVLGGVPALYATENTKPADTIIHLHYFVGACDWWIAELDADRRIAFGYANLGDPHGAEWGYTDLHELRALLVRPQGIARWVERDLSWTPRPFAQVVAR